MDGSSLSYAGASRLLDMAEGWTAGWPASPGPRPQPAPAPAGDGEIRFRQFRLLPRARLLLHNGAPLTLGSRAFDLLHALARARGSVVGKAEIFRSVWPTTVVDESNLRFQVATLRKALGKDRDLVKTIAGRGYLFAADPSPAPQAGPALMTEPGEAGEALRTLLRSALDEFWEMISQDARFGVLCRAMPGGVAPAATNRADACQ